jgi:hypothetical protein
MVGSFAFTFSSFNLLHFDQPDAMAAVAHLPWLLAIIDVIMVDGRWGKVAAAQAGLLLLSASQLLLGGWQYMPFSLLAEAGYTFFLMLTRRRAPRNGCETIKLCRQCVGCGHSSCGRVILAKGLGLSLALLLPSAREAAWAGVASAAADCLPHAGSLHPINLIQLVAPYLSIDRGFQGDVRDVSLYVGAVPLMLVVWLLMRRRELHSMRRLAQAAGGLAVAALILAAGDYNPLVRLERSLPGAEWLRFPCRFIMLFQFAVAVLAAIGFLLLERQSRQERPPEPATLEPTQEGRGAALWKRFEPLWAVVMVGMAVALVGLILRNGQGVASVPQVMVGPLLLATAAILVIAAAQGVRGALLALVLFAAADLGYYGLSCTLPRAREVTHVAAAEAPLGPAPAAEQSPIPNP